MVASVMIVPYILPQIVLKKTLKVMMKVVIHLKKKDSLFLKASFLVFSNSVHNVENYLQQKERILKEVC